MRQLFCVFAALYATALTARAEPPFGPAAKLVDHVVTMADRSPYRKDAISSTITRHGRWIRIDRVDATQSNTAYFADDGAIAISIRDGGGLTIKRGREPYYDYELRDTGVRDTFLGERCTVWEVWRSRDLRKLSCITDDGVVLWYKFTGARGVISLHEATRIERRSIAPSEVQPPPTLLNLNWWNGVETASTGARQVPDHETIMQLGDNTIHAGKIIRTTRYRHPWKLIEENSGTVRRNLTVSHVTRQKELYYNSGDDGGLKRLNIWIVTSPPGKVPLPLNRKETILGETCWWFDMTPGMADASRSRCQTHDGIVLKEHNWSRGSSHLWIAVRLARRAVALREITPPASLLDLAAWMRE
jgi:hypothetical protein